VQGRRREPIALRHPIRVFSLVSAAVIALDQVSKSLVRVLWAASVPDNPLDLIVSALVEPAYRPSESVPVLGEVFQITFVRNTGAAFGLLPGYRPVFIATSLVVLLVVAGYWLAARPSSRPLVLALGLVTGGAVGNLIDRFIFGRVTDFLDIAAFRFPVFNVADSGIVVGVTILVLWLLFSPDEPSAGSELTPIPQRTADERAIAEGDKQ
jgi:signal peptidase II